MKLHEILEALAGTDPDETRDVIQTSFKDRVLSDLLADETANGEQVPAEEVIKELTAKFPSITNNVEFIVTDVDRVRIEFNSDGTGATIKVPKTLKEGLGEVLVLHEIAHMLYTKDIHTNKILKYRDAPQAFTVLRVLEDIAIEKRLEADHPDSVDVFKKRASHIMPIYKTHTPTAFAKQMDSLFLYLRGYSKNYSGSTVALSAAEQYLSSTDTEDKIHAVLTIAEDFMKRS